MFIFADRETGDLPKTIKNVLHKDVLGVVSNFEKISQGLLHGVAGFLPPITEISENWKLFQVREIGGKWSFQLKSGTSF